MRSGPGSPRNTQYEIRPAARSSSDTCSTRLRSRIGATHAFGSCLASGDESDEGLEVATDWEGRLHNVGGADPA